MSFYDTDKASIGQGEINMVSPDDSSARIKRAMEALDGVDTGTCPVYQKYKEWYQAALYRESDEYQNQVAQEAQAKLQVEANQAIDLYDQIEVWVKAHGFDGIGGPLSSGLETAFEWFNAGMPGPIYLGSYGRVEYGEGASGTPYTDVKEVLKKLL